MSDWKRWQENGREGPPPVPFLRPRTAAELHDYADDPALGHNTLPAIAPDDLRRAAALIVERWGRYLKHSELPQPLLDWLLSEELAWPMRDKAYVKYGDELVAWALRETARLDNDSMPLT